MHKVGLNQMSVCQLIPTILRNLDTGLCRRGHHTKLGVDVFLFLSVRQSVPNGPQVSSLTSLSTSNTKTYSSPSLALSLGCASAVRISSAIQRSWGRCAKSQRCKNCSTNESEPGHGERNSGNECLEKKLGTIVLTFKEVLRPITTQR